MAGRSSGPRCLRCEELSGVAMGSEAREHAWVTGELCEGVGAGDRLMIFTLSQCYQKDSNQQALRLMGGPESGDPVVCIDFVVS